LNYTDRALAYVTRERDGRKELLVFDHRDSPDAGTQVPAGRLSNARVVRKIGTFAPHELPHGRSYTNHAFELEAPDAPDAWEHIVAGDGDDAGLVFLYRWVPLSPPPELWGGADPALARLLR
jgi:hypothetical protein